MKKQMKIRENKKNPFLPEHKQERSTRCLSRSSLERWVGEKVLCREKVRKRRVLETAMAVANTKPCEINTDDILVGTTKEDSF